MKRKKKHVVCSSSFTFVSHTHTHGTTLTLSRLIISWCCYCYNRFEWLYWLGKTFFLHGFDFAHKTLKFPITKTKTRLKKKTSSMPVIFIYRTNFHFSWFVYFFHYLMCRHEQNTQTKFPPPSPDPTCVVKGARGIQSWRARFPIERHHFDMPRVCWQQQNPKLGERTTRLSCSPFLFIHFSPSFFHTHTHKGMKKFSHYFCSTVFGSFVISLNIFKQQKRPKNSSEKKCTDKNTFTVHYNNNNITFQFSGCIFVLLFYFFSLKEIPSTNKHS